MPFRFDKLTIKAQEGLARAQELAAGAGNPQIEPVHLLASLLQEHDGLVRPALEKIGANVRQLETIVEAETETDEPDPLEPLCRRALKIVGRDQVAINRAIAEYDGRLTELAELIQAKKPEALKQAKEELEAEVAASEASPSVSADELGTIAPALDLFGES